MTTFAVATPHALILTVSHGLLLCQPLICSGTAAAVSAHRMLFLTGRCFAPNVASHRTYLAPNVSHCHTFSLPAAIVAGIHRCEPFANAPIQTSHAFSNAALTSGFTAVLQPLVMRATARLNARLTDQTSQSEFGDPVCRPIRLSLSTWPALLTSGSQSLEVMLRVFKATRHPHLGPIPWTQASRFRPTFQVLFCRGPMLTAHDLFVTTRARGTFIKSGRGGDTASPAAANSAITACAWPLPSSTMRAPPSASSGGAATAITR